MSSWLNLHKWVVKYCDCDDPNLRNINPYINECGINHPTTTGVTALHFAVVGEQTIVAEFLLQKGASPNLPDDIGATPLHWACRCGSKQIVEELLECGGEIDQLDLENRSPLHYAVEAGNVEVVKLLLERGTNCVEKRDLDGFTPLAVACREEETDVVRLLLRHNAKYKELVLESIKQDNQHTVRMLIECDIDCDNIDTSQNKTPLHFAVQYNSYKTAKLLSNVKNFLKTKDANGLLPKDLLTRSSDPRLVHMLKPKKQMKISNPFSKLS